jgi:hypothetical protein
MSDEPCPDHWFPVSGWSMATLPEKGCLVEVRYLPSPTTPNDDALRLPLALTAEQARELAQHLLLVAGWAEERTDSMPQTMQ